MHNRSRSQKSNFSKEGSGPKNAKNGQIFKSSFHKSFMSLGNSAVPENPLGVIFMQNVRPDNEFDVLTALSLYPLWASYLTLVPWES